MIPYTRAWKARKRHKALTHRCVGRDAYAPFRRLVLALATERSVELGPKALKELDKALIRSRKAPTQSIVVKLRNCGLEDAQALVVLEALRSSPAVDKLDLRGNNVGRATVRAAVDLVERQIAATLRPLTPARLRDDAVARRFHGILADDTVGRTCCLRRVKVDADARRLRQLEVLAPRVNERLAIRHAMLKACATRGGLSCDRGTATLSSASDKLAAAVEAFEATAVDASRVDARGFDAIGDGLEAFESFVYSRLEGGKSLLGAPSPEDLALLGPILEKYSRTTDVAAPPDVAGDRGDLSPLCARSESAFDDDDSTLVTPYASTTLQDDTSLNDDEEDEEDQPGREEEEEEEDVDQAEEEEDQFGDEAAAEEEEEEEEALPSVRDRIFKEKRRVEELSDGETEDEPAEAKEADNVYPASDGPEESVVSEVQVVSSSALRQKMADVARSDLPLSQRLAALERELPSGEELGDDDLCDDDLCDDNLSPPPAKVPDSHPMARPPFRLTPASLRAAAEREGRELAETSRSVDRAKLAFDSFVESRALTTPDNDQLRPAARCVEGRLHLADRSVVGATLLPEIDAALMARDSSYARLASLDISGNRLRWLPVEVFARLVSLEVLDCSDNQLRCLAPASALPYDDDDDDDHYCDKGSPSRREMHSLPGTLVHVDASNNKLETVRGLEACAFLRVVRLAHNAIKEVRGLEHLSRLEELDLSRNKISRQTALRPLSCNHELRFLRLAGCPVDDDDDDDQEHLDPQALIVATLLAPRVPAARPKRRSRRKARAFVVGLLPQLSELNGEPMPRSAMATLERARRRKSLLGRDESATRPPHPPRIRRQRDADAKRAESGKSAVLRRRLADYNLGGGEASPSRGGRESPQPSRAEQVRTMDALSKDLAKPARKKVEPTGRTPRVFGQPWTEPPPPPPTTRLPKGTARRSSTPSNRSDRALSRTAASRRDSLDTIATEETGISPRRRPTTPQKTRKKKKTPATNQDAPTEVVVDAAAPPTLAEPVPFELWLDDLVRHSSNAERAVDVLKKLRKARAAPSNDIAPSDRERLVQPFRETLARLTALATTPPPETALEACVSAPDQLKLAALSWGRARALVAQLRVLVDALFDDAAALDASTVSPETPALADRALKHPLANLAMRLEVELGRINETSKPADDDDDGGGGGGGNTPDREAAVAPVRSRLGSIASSVLSTPARRPSLSSFAPSPRASRSIDDKDDDSAATVRKPASPPPTPADDAPLQEEVIREEEVPGSVDDPEVIQEEEVPGSVDPAPTDAPSEEEDSTVAPSESPAWREGYDNTYEQFFYFNDNTGESIWTKPSGPFKPYEASTSSDDDDQGDEFTAASSQ